MTRKRRRRQQIRGIARPVRVAVVGEDADPARDGEARDRQRRRLSSRRPRIGRADVRGEVAFDDVQRLRRKAGAEKEGDECDATKESRRGRSH